MSNAVRLGCGAGRMYRSVELTTLDCDMPLTINADNVRLDLRGHTLSCMDSGGGLPDGIVSFNRTGVVIRDGTISGCDDGIFLVGANDAHLRDLTVTNSDTSGIFFVNSHESRITGSEVIGSGSNGVLFINSDGNMIVGNEMTQSGDSGIFLLGGSDDNRLVNNELCDNGFNGVFLSNSSLNSIIDNDANDNTSVGILLVGQSHDNKLLSNTTDSNDVSGITLFGPQTGNVIRDNHVADNVLRGIALAGRVVDPGASVIPSENAVQSNHVVDNGDGTTGFVDLFEGFIEFDLTTFIVDATCHNDWIDNVFATQFGPAMCIN